MKRTYKYGETLTEDEQRFICKAFLCPDCGTGKFLEGPSGGASQNVYCDTCPSKFNFMLPFGIDRISESSRNKEEDEKPTVKIAVIAIEGAGELPKAEVRRRDSWPITIAKAVVVVCLGAFALWLAGCKNDEERAMEKAKGVFGDAPVQCDKVEDGVACENLCTHEVLLCPSDKDTRCHYVTYIKLANTPAVSCPKAEKRYKKEPQ